MAIEKNQSLNKQTSRTIGLLDLIIEQVKGLRTAYETNDKKLADKINKNDYNINLEFQYIIDKSNWILSQHVFFGEELRKILGYNSICKEFERLGDVVAKIASHLVISSPRERQRKDILHFLQLINNSLCKLRKQVANPVEKDIVAFSKEASKHFDFYEERKKEYIKEIAKEQNILVIEKMIDELHLAKRIENMSSFIENTCEYLIYILTGRNIDL